MSFNSDNCSNIKSKYSLLDATTTHPFTANKKTVEFLEQFKKENGSYICNYLLGCDISTTEGVQYAMEHNCFTEVCPKMVASAVKILESMEG